MNEIIQLIKEKVMSYLFYIKINSNTTFKYYYIQIIMKEIGKIYYYCIFCDKIFINNIKKQNHQKNNNESKEIFIILIKSNSMSLFLFNFIRMIELNKNNVTYVSTIE